MAQPDGARPGIDAEREGEILDATIETPQRIFARARERGEIAAGVDLDLIGPGSGRGAPAPRLPSRGRHGRDDGRRNDRTDHPAGRHRSAVLAF